MGSKWRGAIGKLASRNRLCIKLCGGHRSRPRNPLRHQRVPRRDTPNLFSVNSIAPGDSRAGLFSISGSFYTVFLRLVRTILYRGHAQFRGQVRQLPMRLDPAPHPSVDRDVRQNALLPKEVADERPADLP